MHHSKHCRFCEGRCQKEIPTWVPSFVLTSYPRGAVLHTCRPGQASDKRVRGYCWADVQAMRPEATLGDIAARVVGLPMMEFLTTLSVPTLRKVEALVKADAHASRREGDRVYMQAWLIGLQVVRLWLEAEEPAFEPA